MKGILNIKETIMGASFRLGYLNGDIGYKGRLEFKPEGSKRWLPADSNVERINEVDAVKDALELFKSIVLENGQDYKNFTVIKPS